MSLIRVFLLGYFNKKIPEIISNIITLPFNKMLQFIPKPEDKLILKIVNELIIQTPVEVYFENEIINYQ